MKHILFVLAAAAALCSPASPRRKTRSMDPKSCPMHAEHMKAQAAADQRFAEMQRARHSLDGLRSEQDHAPLPHARRRRSH